MIQQLDRKKALAAEWIPPDAKTFAVATAGGFFELYKAKSDSQEAIRTISLKTAEISRA